MDNEVTAVALGGLKEQFDQCLNHLPFSHNIVDIFWGSQMDLL